MGENKLGKVPYIAPAIFKPEPLWTGKQLITALLKIIRLSEQNPKEKEYLGFNMQSKIKLPAEIFGPFGKEETQVLTLIINNNISLNLKYIKIF